MNEDDLLPHRTHEDVEQKTIELTKDITHIRQLWQNPLSSFTWVEPFPHLPFYYFVYNKSILGDRSYFEPYYDESNDSSHKRTTITLSRFYVDRNLVGEDEKEQRRAKALSNLQSIHDKARGINVKIKRSIFRRRSSRKKSTGQGLILAGISGVGVHAMAHSNANNDGKTEEEKIGLQMRNPEDDHQLYTINESMEANV